MIIRTTPIVINGQTTQYVYSHEENFTDHLCSLMKYDLKPLFKNKPLVIKEIINGKIEFHNFSELDTILYSLKTHIVNIYRGIESDDKKSPLIQSKIIGECEAIYNKCDSEWHIYKKIDAWQLCPFEGCNPQWISPCGNFLIRQLNYKIGHYYDISTLDGKVQAIKEHSDINGLIEYYNTPQLHTLALHKTEDYKKYYPKLSSIAEKQEFCAKTKQKTDFSLSIK